MEMKAHQTPSLQPLVKRCEKWAGFLYFSCIEINMNKQKVNEWMGFANHFWIEKTSLIG